MSNQVIAVDAGKHTTKAMTRVQGEKVKLDFRTKILQIDNIDLDAQGTTFKVEFGGHTYFVGEQGEIQDYDVSKNSLLHRLCIYTSAGLLMDSKSVTLVCGCPLSVYANKQLKEKYRESIFDNGYVKIGINGEVKTLYIDKVLIPPESSGILYICPEMFKGKRSAVIDLGGLNLNAGIYNGLSPEVSSLFTKNLGSVELENDIIKQLNSKFAIDIKPNEVPFIIENGGITFNSVIHPDSIAIVDGCINAYFQKIIQATRQQGYNLDRLNQVVFVGGTSQLLKDRIHRHFPHAVVPPDSQYTNCTGFLKAGEANGQ